MGCEEGEIEALIVSENRRTADGSVGAGEDAMQEWGVKRGGGGGERPVG